MRSAWFKPTGRFLNDLNACFSGVSIDPQDERKMMAMHNLNNRREHAPVS